MSTRKTVVSIYVENIKEEDPFTMEFNNAFWENTYIMRINKEEAKKLQESLNEYLNS